MLYLRGKEKVYIIKNKKRIVIESMKVNRMSIQFLGKGKGDI